MSDFIKALLVLIFIGSAISVVSGQTTVSILNASSMQPISGAYCEVSKAGKVSDILISNDQGLIVISGKRIPFDVSARHLGYRFIKTRISQSGNHQLLMFEQPIEMKDVVVTGQFEPQSIDESVFSVTKINRKKIEAQAAVNLSDVLSNNLNITLRPSVDGDRTEIEMLGLDGRHVKVLVDGVPLVGVSGNGNSADLTQINMSGIERIEIVEGPMSVNYGANATAGVINLITRKSSREKLNLDFSIQEETVGPEYGWNEGRHIQTLGVGYRLHENFYTRLDYRHNDFKGLKGKRKGFDHTQNDSLRGFEWQPKAQHFGRASFTFKRNGTSLRYNFDYLDQSIDLPSVIVFKDEHSQTGIERPFSFDRRFNSIRTGHGLQADGTLKKVIGYSFITNYSALHRDEILIRKRILTNEEEEIVDRQKSAYKSATTRGQLSYFINDKKLGFQGGAEHTYENILASNVTGGFKSLNNLAVFGSMEWTLGDKLKFRPGLRTIFNSIWSTPLIYSFHVKYAPTSDLDVRMSYGRSYRTPNLTELYYYFVDANHDVTGNANLKPEDGQGYALDVKYKKDFSGVELTSSIKGFYNHIKDQITLAVVNDVPLQFQYTNVDVYKSVGLTWTNNLTYKALSLNAGLTYVGRLNRLTGNTVQNRDVLADEMLFSVEYNLNAQYKIETLNLTFSGFYKHTGRKEQIRLGANDQLEKGRVDAFDWLDITTSWSPSSSKIEIGGGVKNALNLTSINSSAETAGTHAAASSQRGLAYGRSYFLKFSYKIKK